MVNIVQDYIPQGRKNRPAKSNPCNYITIHNTGNSSKGANAKSHANYIKSDAAANSFVSWHYTVDDSSIYQHLPDNETAFHAGDGSGKGNSTSIGIEICMNSDGDLLKATDSAAELAASLCKKHNIPIENVVQHNYWSGKNCPQMIRSGKPYTWGVFINKVKNFLIDTPPVTDPSNDLIRFDLMGKIVDISGKLIDNTSYVAARALLEALGFKVTWNQESKTVIVQLSDSTVKVDLFGEKTVDIPGRLVNNINFVAIRALMEAMGFETGWDKETQAVTVRYGLQ